MAARNYYYSIIIIIVMRQIMISAFKTLSTFGCLGNRREAGHHGSSFTSARTTSPIPVLLFLFFNSFFHRLFWTNMKYYLNAKNDNRRGGGVRGLLGFDPEVTSTSPSCIETGKMAADTQVCVAGF